ncbi:hypothetical protein FACS189472_05200 [Alphaproteobacteria bacterium]|nr:hypothetical protein FACS189472_05200 [Alphaproteobacteria bacterium]
MKIVLLCLSCILLIGCESEKVQPQEDYIAETQMTEDMQKIKDICIGLFREETSFYSRKRLKRVKIICEFYGKDNKRLNRELDKINSCSSGYDEYQKRVNDLHAPMKGLRLNCNQVLLLSREIEKAKAEIVANDRKSYDQYKTRAIEILKDIQAKDDAKNDWHDEPNDGISSSHRYVITENIEYVVNDNRYNKYTELYYRTACSELFGYIDYGTLKDSFLEKTSSPFRAINALGALTCGNKDPFTWIAPGTDREGIIIFDAVRNAVKNTTIERKRLEQIVHLAAFYLRTLASSMTTIQNNVADIIDRFTLDYQRAEDRFRNFDPEDNMYSNSKSRFLLVELVEKYPKFEDFERRIDEIAARLAYYTYHEFNVLRSFYAEWRRNYLPQMEVFFKNSRILAERLHNICKDEKISDNDTDMHKSRRQSNIANIVHIREITSTEPEIFFAPSAPLSQQKIKESYKNWFMKIRESYLRHMREKL